MKGRRNKGKGGGGKQEEEKSYINHSVSAKLPEFKSTNILYNLRPGMTVYAFNLRPQRL